MGERCTHCFVHHSKDSHLLTLHAHDAGKGGRLTKIVTVKLRRNICLYCILICKEKYNVRTVQLRHKICAIYYYSLIKKDTSKLPSISFDLRMPRGEKEMLNFLPCPPFFTLEYGIFAAKVPVV